MITQSTQSLRKTIASNKFYPPRINQSQSLLRHEIISKRVPDTLDSKKIIVIEAQAGQGKTTLVHQYLDFSGHPFIWYQIGTEDNDPVLLLSALQLALSKKIDNFTSPQLIDILEKGQVGPMDLQGCANILLNDIDSILEEDMFIVFDDMHLISNSQLTNSLLDYLIDTSPPKLHFIVTSRHPLQLNAQMLTRNPLLTYLDTSDLALEITDIENLYHNVFNMELSRAEAKNVFQITNGWIMGIVLAANPFAKGKTKNFSSNNYRNRAEFSADSKDGYLLSYFEEEIFSHVPTELHSVFLTLSFLDEIDIELALVLTQFKDIDQHLGQMADENFFVYRLDDEGTVFRFHHLFQEFLQILGKKQFSTDQIAAIYSSTADYYLEQNLIEKGLKALRSGEDYVRMERVLKENGLRLVAANRTVTIMGILQSIPEATLLKHGWLTFFLGLLSTDFTPRLTLPFFESCNTQFAESGDETGELMSLSQLIYFHFVISGNYRTGSKLLERTRTLFERNVNMLPAEVSILVARNLAAGYCFFDGRLKDARHYAQIACDLATRRDSLNFIASSRFILGYIGLLSGNGRVARNETEKSFALAHNPMVGMSNRLTLHIMQLCQLSMYGDINGFMQHKEMIQAGVDQKVVRQTVAAPYLYVWSSIAMIGAGKPEEAVDIIEHGMLVSKTAAIDHMTSQFLQWRAFAHAVIGNNKQVQKDLELSTSLRKEAGGPFYTAYHYSISGAAMTLTGNTKKGRELLNKGLETGKEIGSDYIKACCLAYLCISDIIEKKDSTVPTSLNRWLSLMKSCKYSYFWGWEPTSMLRLLSAAVTLDIEADFACQLARQRFAKTILPDGTIIPLLAINCLGEFSIGTATEKMIGPQDLNTNQRELIGLLISSPNHRISQEHVQLNFWPDSAPEKARKSFDTLMSRLRSVLKTKLPFSHKHYITVEKGYVQLTNITIDAAVFMDLAEEGRKLSKQGAWWQAGNIFTSALTSWKHFLPTETFISDQTVTFYDDVQITLKSVCLTWCGMLSEHNRLGEALAILERTEKLLALDEDCVALRYRLYVNNHNPRKAREILQHYREELLRLEYTTEEADDIVASITENRTIH